MERLELGEDNDGSEDEAATADLNPEFEAAEAEAEVEAGGQAEEEAEFAELQAEAMLAVEAELKEIGILNAENPPEVSIDNDGGSTSDSELKEIGILNAENPPEVSIDNDGGSTSDKSNTESHTKFRDGLPHYSDEQIQQRIAFLLESEKRTEYEITLDDETKVLSAAGPLPTIRYESGTLYPR